MRCLLDVWLIMACYALNVRVMEYVMETIDFKNGLVGRKLANKYVLQKPIGAGGMGSVYRGIQLGTEARVSV